MKNSLKLTFIIFIIAFVSNSICLTAQKISKQQGDEDLSFLYKCIDTYCAFLPLQEQRTKTSFADEFSQLRSLVKDSLEIKDLANIVRQSFNILYDKHSGIATINQIIWYNTADHYLKSVGNSTIQDTIHATRNFNYVNSDAFKQLKCWIRADYSQGKYYNIRPFMYNDTLITCGEEISAIDNIPLNDFVMQNRYRMYNLLWDPLLEQWYDDSFISSLLELGKKEFTLTIGSKEVRLSYDKTPEGLKAEHKQSDRPFVTILDDSILFIRIPQMSNADFYIKEIIAQYNPNIKKIAFDIRSNGGGDDMVWQKILANILAEPLTYEQKIGIPCREDIKSATKSFGQIHETGEKTCIQTNSNVISPTDKSIRFIGKVYLLQDKYTFSAAAALSSVAMQNENIILVGERSALIAGYTFPGLMFRLPHSGIVFKLAFSFDNTGGKENPYMDKVEVEISENITEYIERVIKNDNYSNEILLQKDKFVKYVREN